MSYSPALSITVSPKIFFPFWTSGRMTQRTACNTTNDTMIWLWRAGDKLAFKNGITIPYFIEDGCFCAFYNIGEHVIASAETTYDAMVEDLKSQIIDAWEYYAKEDDSNLSDGAKDVKYWLLDNLAEG